MKEIQSFSNVVALGHKIVDGIMDGEITIEEKVDGSQISFMVKEGNLFVRSKGQMIDIENPENMFKTAIEQIKTIASLLKEGWIYRGEYLEKPKHNTICYNRVPIKNIIIYDIDKADQCYLNHKEKKEEANRIGLEVVPLFYQGKLKNKDMRDLLKKESILGGAKIEGVVIKNYEMFSRDKKTLMAKLVNEEFKETHQVEWGKNNPKFKDVVSLIGEEMRNENRWHKAYIHLKEKGVIEENEKDISKIMKEVPIDILKEEEVYIKDKLFKYAFQDIIRIAGKGIPEWYKLKLKNNIKNDK